MMHFLVNVIVAFAFGHALNRNTATVGSLRLQGKADENPQLTVFWHIAALKGHEIHLEIVLARQWARLNASGLLHNATIKIGFVNQYGKEEDQELYKKVPSLPNIFQHPLVEIVAQAQHGYECLTTNQLWQYARNFSGHTAGHQYILYMHSRGVTHGDPPSPGDDWTQMMEYFLIDHWSYAIHQMIAHEALTSGVELWAHPNRKHLGNTWHYAGNFWWATASYVTKLPSPYLLSEKETDRYACGEDWILEDWQGEERHQCLHYTGQRMFERGRINAYIDRYPKEFYDCLKDGVPSLTPCKTIDIHQCHGEGCALVRSESLALTAFRIKNIVSPSRKMRGS